MADGFSGSCGTYITPPLVDPDTTTTWSTTYLPTTDGDTVTTEDLKRLRKFLRAAVKQGRVDSVEEGLDRLAKGKKLRVTPKVEFEEYE